MSSISPLITYSKFSKFKLTDAESLLGQVASYISFSVKCVLRHRQKERNKGRKQSAFSHLETFWQLCDFEVEM